MDMHYVEHLLSDVPYPADKRRLMEAMRSKGAQEALPLLAQLPEQKFASMEEVLKVLPLYKINISEI